MVARAALLLGFNLRDSRLHQFPDERRRHWLVGGEVNGSFGDGVGRKILLEGCDDTAGWEQTAVIRKRGVPDEHFPVLEGWDPIADDLGRFRRHSGPNGSANLVQSGAGGFGDASEVFIDGGWDGLAFRRRTALARFHLVHVDNSNKGR
jgi:hypothetical protein